MSFLDRAKQAANSAAEAAKHAAGEAQAAAGRASDKLSDPATAEKARQALSKAKKGISTAIDRIDPNVLADVVIKATALQEKANSALKAKGSLYRISEIDIGAAIPPSVTFAITRIDDPMESATAVSSTELLHAVGLEPEGTVTALDGTQLDESKLAEEVSA
jgi:sulfur carrier protein ThiS